MASGPVSRTHRPNTWLHRPAATRARSLDNPEPSTHGPGCARRKVERRRAQLEESVARNFSQLDTVDLQEPTETLAAKTKHLKEKLAKVHSEMQRLQDQSVGFRDGNTNILLDGN